MGLVIPGSGTTANLLVGDSIRTQRGRTIAPPINYIDNPSFTSALTTGWATYADAAAVTPVDGTGGTPNVTFTAVSSSLVRGVVSGRLTKDAVNRQGQGVAYAFTLDAADTGLPVSLSLDFVASANFVANDVGVYIYDVTNAVLITPASVNISAGKGTFRAFFVASTSTSYRLILHVASTNASAWTLDTDTLYAGPQVQLLGAAVTDWSTVASYSAISNGGGGTQTTIVEQSRVGDTAHFRVSYSATVAGAGTGNIFTFTLPAGLLIDGTKLANSGTLASSIGQGYVIGGATGTRIGISARVVASSNKTIQFPAFSFTRNLSSADIEANAIVGFLVSVPIANWSSNVTMAERAVEEYAWNSSTTDATDSSSFGNGLVGITFGTYTGERLKRVRFQTPIQTTDTLILEIQQAGTGPWFAIQTTANGVIPWFESATRQYGMRLNNVSATDVDVVFAKDGRRLSADNLTSVGAAFGDITTWRWRVRKVSSGAAIGGAIGTPNIVGRVDGLAPAAGMLGQQVRQQAGAATVTSGVVTNLLSIELTAGVWDLSGTGYFSGTTLTGYNMSIGVASLTNGLLGDNFLGGSLPSGFGDINLSIPQFRIIVASTTTFFMTVNIIGTGTVQARGRLSAVRIA